MCASPRYRARYAARGVAHVGTRAVALIALWRARCFLCFLCWGCLLCCCVRGVLPLFRPCVFGFSLRGVRRLLVSVRFAVGFVVVVRRRLCFVGSVPLVVGGRLLRLRVCRSSVRLAFRVLGCAGLRFVLALFWFLVPVVLFRAVLLFLPLVSFVVLVVVAGCLASCLLCRPRRFVGVGFVVAAASRFFFFLACKYFAAWGWGTRRLRYAGGRKKKGGYAPFAPATPPVAAGQECSNFFH